MICEYCSKETINQTRNQFICRVHIDEAKIARDKHNERVLRIKSIGYQYTQKLIKFTPEMIAVDGLLRVSLKYQLNKMYYLKEHSDGKSKVEVQTEREILPSIQGLEVRVSGKE